jgi:hypothetical protein
VNEKQLYTTKYTIFTSIRALYHEFSDQSEDGWREIYARGHPSGVNEKLHAPRREKVNKDKSSSAADRSRDFDVSYTEVGNMCDSR